MTIEAPGRVQDPYVGPVSFRLGDPLYGRDREREDLLDLLIAERIVLLYSPSGAGKSSLIEAALVPALRDAAFEVLPTIRVTHALPPEPGMPAPRNRYVMGTLLSLEEGVPSDKQRPVAELATLTLREYLTAYADRDDRPGNEVLIFDQFEEVLTADPTDEPTKHAFFKELGDVLRDRGHWALFSMREDFLAALDPYLKYLPTRLRTTFRLDLLSVPEALEAIRRPAQRAGVNFTEDAAMQLVDDLRIVRVQRPTGITEVLGSYVEPVQLQVACHLLWSTLPVGATEITRTDVEALGRVDQALGGYYADRVRAAAASTGVSERVIRDWFDENLITPQGLRSQVLQGPEPSSEAGHRLLGELLDAHLVRAETRRQATWYELAHDRLIEPVRRDNEAWRLRHLSSVERSAMLWEQEGKPDRLLLLGTDLASAQQDESVRAGTLTNRQREFLDASRRADEQARRDIQTATELRRSARRLRITAVLTTVLAVASVTLLVLSVIAWNQSVAATNRAEAQEVASRLLLDAQRNLDVDQDLAVALAVEGTQSYPSGPLPEHVRDILYRAAGSPVSLAFRGQPGPTASATISEGANVVVTAGTEDIRVWDRQNGALRDSVGLERGDEVNTIDATDDGQTVVAGTMDGTLLVWEVGTEHPLRWDEGTDYVWEVAVSPEGDRFASVGAGNEIQVWGFDREQQLALHTPGSDYFNSVDFSPDGSLVAAANGNAEVILWDAESGAERERLSLPEDAWSVAFGASGDALATVASSAVTVWDLNPWQPRYPPLEQDSGLHRSVDGELQRALSVDTFGNVTVYDLASGLEVASSSVPGASTWGAGFDVDPGNVLVLGKDVDPAFWSLRPAGTGAWVTAASWSERGLVEAWSDGTIMWAGEGTDGEQRRDPGIRTEDQIYELSADEDGGTLAAATDVGLARVWDTTTGAQLFTPESDAMFWDVALTPDGATLITGDSFGDVTTWDIATGEKLGDILLGEGRAITELRVSPDGSTVLAVLQPANPFFPDARVALAAPIAGGTTTEFELADDEDAEVTSASFGPDGKTVILGTASGHIARLDAESGESVWPDDIDPHQGAVNEVLVEPDGTIITTGADDKVVLLDAEGGEIRQVASGSKPLAAVVTSDGREMAMVTADDGALTVPLDDAVLRKVVRSKMIYDLPSTVCKRYGLDADC